MSNPLKTARFGVNIQTSAQRGADPTAEALHAEQLGYDVVTVHRDVLHGNDPSFEIWTLLTWLAARTTRITVAPVVLALPHRQPSVLAKMAETLDRLSAGRLALVLGSGAAINEAGYRALGLVQRSPREKVEALGEAIDVLRGLWGVSGFSYAGQHFRTEAATIEPKPGHRIPIWLGVFGPRMVDLVGRKADGWIPTFQLLEPEQAFRQIERIRRIASDTGRNPDEITFAYNVPVYVEEGAVTTKGRIAGNAEEVAGQLADLIRGGFTFLNLWTSGESAAQRERLAREVIPTVRERVGW
jgi:alkanesulfonate monooxygenase SsuD/methylene tetrahydromethanopterin reductase-like flavin-dependent oxidoreductase (luciferase family)